MVAPKLLVDVPRPEGNNFYAHYFKSKSRVCHFVEFPMVKAVEHLFTLGIQTYGSGACATEVANGYAFLLFIYDSLSAENKSIADKLGIVENGTDGSMVRINIDVHQKTTVKYIQQVTMAYVTHFKPQTADWAQVSREQLSKMSNEQSIHIQEVIELYGYYRDLIGRYWLSEDLYNINRHVRISKL